MTTPKDSERESYLEHRLEEQGVSERAQLLDDDPAWVAYQAATARAVEVLEGAQRLPHECIGEDCQCSDVEIGWHEGLQAALKEVRGG